MDRLIVTFSSTRDAIMAERTCLQNGLACQAIPLPREISAECGIALQINPLDKDAVASLLTRSKIVFVINL